MTQQRSEMTWRVSLKVRVAVNERPVWLREGLAQRFSEYTAATAFVDRLADWLDRGVSEIATIKAVVR